MNLRSGIWLLALVVILSAVHLSIFTKNMNSKYEVDDLKRTAIGLTAETRNLSDLSAEKMGLGKIENIAKNKLHMLRPDDMNYVPAAASNEIAP